jgi:exodeoxyribonuclease V beta subunit
MTTLRTLEPTTLPLRSVALIEASAGTGKTFTITTLYVRLVLEGLDVGKILVVTYTNAATAELRDRVRQRLRQALDAFGGAPGADATLAALVAARASTRDDDCKRLIQALRSFDEAAIFTIHGFCQRMLQDHAFESRVAFEVELVTEQDLLRDEIVRDFWAREIATAPRWFVELLEHEGIKFLRLSRLAKKAAENSRLRVVPRAVRTADVSLAAWEKAWKRAAKIWGGKREEILRLLEQPGVLYKKPFEAARQRFGPFLDVELSDLRPWISRRFADVRHVTPDGLKEKTLKGRQTPAHAFFEACGDLVAAEDALAEAARPQVLQLQLQLVDYVHREIRSRKEAANQQSFDDLLNRLDDALVNSPALAAQIREKFPAALIDEFQDTDPVQYGIFRKIYLGIPAKQGGTSLFLIGDPKQAIYSFRGADVFTYMSARGDVKDGEFTLGTNWRSDPGLIQAVNALFARAPAPFVFGDIPFQSVAARDGAENCLGGSAAGVAPLEILIAEGDSIAGGTGNANLPPLVAAEIARFLQSGATLRSEPVGPGDIAVLCRTNAQARATHHALQVVGVPAVLYGDASVFDSDEAVEVERVLRAMAAPGDSAALRAALVTTLVGLGGEELDRLRDDEARWDDVVLEFTTLSETWRTRGFVAAFRRMLEVYGVEARLLSWVDGERRLTNVLHLGELLQNAAVEGHLGPLALVEWLARLRSDRQARGEVGSEAAQIRLESDALRVKVTTVHQAKGLEYPIVYCPFLWTRFFPPSKEGFTFHDPAAGHERRLDLGSDEREEHERLYTREELGESLRLLYVALTRAKHRCSIVWGRFREGNCSALGYLLHRAAMTPADFDVQEVMNYVDARIKNAAKFREDLDAIVRAARGTIAVRDLRAEERVRYRGAREVEEITTARVVTRAIDDGWRTSSFTRLAAGGGRISAPAEEGIDYDEGDEPAAGEPRPLPEGPVVLHEFAKGARAGELLHEVLEEIDFAASSADVALAVEKALVGNGFEAGEWGERVTAAIVDVLATPLGGAAGSLRLRDVAKQRRSSEMEFLFPVGGADGRLTGAKLADVLRRHGAPRSRPGYGERVRALGFTPLAGFLRGFIDLVFEHDGRWYVVDWKSNFLGAVASAYSPARLDLAMEQHHYFLQYHLYAVALHRHLGARLPAYDAAKQFGGVYYLFLRGMSPRHPAGTGVFHDRPADALIEDLSAICIP